MTASAARPTVNRQWLLAARPNGRAIEETDFRFVETPVPDLKDGEALIRTLYLGFDPAQKGWMENVAGYVAPMAVGDVMRGSGIGQVIESRSDHLKPGDMVRGTLGWQDYVVQPPGGGQMPIEKADTTVPLTANLSVLSTTGLTAYFGLMDVGRPRAGDTVVVSGAAGATGSAVGQIAKIAGCRVIGIAGGPDKCRQLMELGFDGAIDYKAGSVKKRLRELCPNGIDVFFDNVGGDILNDALALIAMNARVVICGGISRYSAAEMPPGPENYFNIVFMRARMEGFIVLDYMARFPEARRRLAGWLREGRLSVQEDIQQGFENAPRTLMRLFEGKNLGKQMLKVADPLPM